MPKKKSSRPNSSLGSNQKPEPKSASQIRRERTVRTAAIVIVLALLLSLIAGAFTVTPSQAAGNATLGTSSTDTGNVVQIRAAEQIVDTDGDGIENNADSDVDGDGIVNGEDSDIDGDGIENFQDADPIDTTDVDSNAPEKPIRPVGAGNAWAISPVWLIGGLVVVIAISISGWRYAKKREN